MNIEFLLSLVYVMFCAFFAVYYFDLKHKNDNEIEKSEVDRYAILEMIFYMVFWPYFLIKLIFNKI